MIIFIYILFILLILLIYSLVRSMLKPTNFPPGPMFLPWIGNSIQLRKEAANLGGQHLVFEQWAKKYNSNVLGFKLGNELVVIALTYSLVHEIHLNEVFEGRPDNFFLRLRTMGTRLGITCTDGYQWYEQRNFAIKQMKQVGYGRSIMNQHIQKEAESLVKLINDTKSVPVWPGTFLAPSVINVLWSLTAGKSIERDNKKLIKLLDLLNKRSKVFDLCGGTLTQFPFLRYFMPNRIGYNLVCQLNDELYSFFKETINDHKNCMTSTEIRNDFIYSYLREIEKSEGNKTIFNETQLIMTILDFFIAGSQTTSNTLDLAIMMLAQRIELQELIFKEIRKNPIGYLNDSLNLSYQESYPLTSAFIMEVQRYFHITPITGPRRALWDTTLGGYNIPKNTTILIGLRSVHMDKSHWGDPQCFRPHRFLEADGTIIKNEYFMPFGQGRRRCIGDTLAKTCLFVFLVKILQNFSINLCEENLPSMSLLPGITLSPKPYKIKFIKRP